MKSIFLFLFVFVSFLSACQKEESRREEPTVQSNPCDPCALYEVTIVSDNPEFTFSVFHNNQVVNGTFEACEGDFISLNYSQNCQSFGGCGQWSVSIQKNGSFLVGSSSGASSFSQQFIVLSP